VVEGVMTSPTNNPYLDALLWLTPSNPFQDSTSSGSRPTTITYAFGAADTDYKVYDPESDVDLVHTTAWQTYEQAAVMSGLPAWANVANISFSRLRDGIDSSRADLNVLITDEAGMRAYFSGERGIQAMATLANNYGPNYGEPEPNYTPGYAIFNNEGYAWTRSGLQPGGLGYVTVIHEIGHLLGLDHP
jgi:serralysin